MGVTLNTTNNCITALEATCSVLPEINSLLRATLNDLEGRSHRLNIRIVGIKEEEFV